MREVNVREWSTGSIGDEQQGLVIVPYGAIHGSESLSSWQLFHVKGLSKRILHGICVSQRESSGRYAGSKDRVSAVAPAPPGH